MTGTYITQARAALITALGETKHDQTLGLREQGLLDLHTLLVLVRGEECCDEDVYDAWAVAHQRERPGYNALVPFSQVDEPIVALGVPYRDAIRMVARRLGDVP